MSEDTVTATWANPGPVERLEVNVYPHASIWIDSRVKPGGDGSQERPFSSLEEAFWGSKSPDNP